jgi:hypothetical protein
MPGAVRSSGGAFERGRNEDIPLPPFFHGENLQMHLFLASLAPIMDQVYSHLPGGSFFGFLYTLPDHEEVSTLLFSLPGATSVVSTLSNLGVFG